MNRRGVVAAAGAAAALVLTAAILHGGAEDDPSAPGPEAAAPSGDRAAPSSGAGAATPAEHGARRAAVAFATATQDWLYLADDAIEAEVRAAAAPQAAARLTTETVERLRGARQALAGSSGRVWWLVRPLAARVVRFEPPGARVEVWVVTVLSAAGVAAPQVEWRTAAVDLVWLDGAWRLADIAERPGPTPTPGPKDRPWDAVSFDQALVGFRRLSSTEGSS